MDPDGDGDPADGIDGWRLDVAFCVSHPFWRAWRTHVRAINPQAYIVGELFGTDEVLASYLQGDTFDAAMNYPFSYACYEYFNLAASGYTLLLDVAAQWGRILLAVPDAP
jgi:glycosidase